MNKESFTDLLLLKLLRNTFLYQLILLCVILLVILAFTQWQDWDSILYSLFIYVPFVLIFTFLNTFLIGLTWFIVSFFISDILKLASWSLLPSSLIIFGWYSLSFYVPQIFSWSNGPVEMLLFIGIVTIINYGCFFRIIKSESKAEE